MASFVILGNHTEQGVANIKDLPDRLAAQRQQLEAAGGRMISYYMTLGAYDFVAVVELPDAEAGARMLLATAAQGNVRTTTMQAFTEEETASILASLDPGEVREAFSMDWRESLP